MRTLVLATLLLAGCNGAPGHGAGFSTACVYGHLYGYEYVSHSRPTYPLFDDDGKPIKCKATP